MNEFGALLRTLRLKQGYPRQYQAAQACNLSPSYWSKLERAQVADRPPSLELIDQIADGLKLTPSEHDALLQASGQSTPVAHLEAVRTLLRVLRDAGLRQDVEDHLNQDMQLLIQCWVDYASAKEHQYERQWEAAAGFCDSAQLRIRQLAGRITAYLLDTKAASLLHHNKLDQVAAIHQEIQGYVAVAQDSYIAALSIMHQGDHRRAGDHWEEARTFYLAAYDRFRTMPLRWRETARCERKIATTYLHQGDWLRAQMYLESAHNRIIAQQGENRQEGEYELARTLYVMGWAANLSGDWAQAYHHHQEGILLAQSFTTKREQSDDYLVMLGQTYLAIDERQLGELEAAQHRYDLAANICEELGCTREKAWIALGQARLEAQRARAAGYADGRPDPALCRTAQKTFDRALLAAQQTGSKYQQIMVLCHRGQLALDQATPEGEQRAQEDFNTALQFALELGSDYYVASVKRQLCELYLRRGNFNSLNHLAADVEELHRRYRYYNHMAWLRTVEAKAVLATASTLESQEVQADVASRYADALAYGVCFNEPWARAILADLARTVQPLDLPIQEAIRHAVVQRLRIHPEISSYQRDRQRLRDEIAGALSAMETIPA